MDHDPAKSFELRFTISNYLETEAYYKYNSYRVSLIFSCNEFVDYKITSSLQALTQSERTINLFLDEIPNSSKARYGFDDFTCEPKDCCVIEDYSVLNDLSPTAVVNDTEVELVRNVNKNYLTFKDNSKIYSKTYYIFAKTSKSSTNSNAPEGEVIGEELE